MAVSAPGCHPTRESPPKSNQSLHLHPRELVSCRERLLGQVWPLRTPTWTFCYVPGTVPGTRVQEKTNRNLAMEELTPLGKTNTDSVGEQVVRSVQVVSAKETGEEQS